MSYHTGNKIITLNCSQRKDVIKRKMKNHKKESSVEAWSQHHNNINKHNPTKCNAKRKQLNRSLLAL